MTPTEPSSGKAATVPSHYETLRGLVARYERSFRITGAPDVPVYFTGTDKAALTALLADYERMREENAKLKHQLDDLLITMSGGT